MKCEVRNCRVFNFADFGSDNSLLMADLMVKVRKQHRRKAPRGFDVEKLLVNQEIAREFEVSKGGRLEPPLEMDWGTTDAMDEAFREVTNEVTENTVGFMPPTWREYAEKEEKQELYASKQSVI